MRSPVLTGHCYNPQMYDFCTKDMFNVANCLIRSEIKFWPRGDRIRQVYVGGNAI